jgi:hypothetical protein
MHVLNSTVQEADAGGGEGSKCARCRSQNAFTIDLGGSKQSGHLQPICDVVLASFACSPSGHPRVWLTRTQVPCGCPENIREAVIYIFSRRSARNAVYTPVNDTWANKGFDRPHPVHFCGDPRDAVPVIFQYNRPGVHMHHATTI